MVRLIIKNNKQEIMFYGQCLKEQVNNIKTIIIIFINHKIFIII